MGETRHIYTITQKSFSPTHTHTPNWWVCVSSCEQAKRQTTVSSSSYINKKKKNNWWHQLFFILWRRQQVYVCREACYLVIVTFQININSVTLSFVSIYCTVSTVDTYCTFIHSFLHIEIHTVSRTVTSYLQATYLSIYLGISAIFYYVQSSRFPVVQFLHL